MSNKLNLKPQIITQADIVNGVMSDFDGRYSEKEISDILESFMNCCIYYLRWAKEDAPIIIKALNGLEFSAKIIPEKIVNNLGKTYKQVTRIKASAKFSRYFNRVKMNDF